MRSNVMKNEKNIGEWRFNIHVQSLILAMAISITCGLQASHGDELDERLLFWEDSSYRCASIPHFGFPSGHVGGSLPCEDGDMVLFAGLLCAAGDEEGCETVRRSQKLVTGEDFGRWYRSPRRMLSDNDTDEDGRGDEEEPTGVDLDGDGRVEEHEWNTFSYDMAIGAMLYLAAKNDKVAGQAWWNWLDNYTPCAWEAFGNCFLQGLPRFCAAVPAARVAGVVDPCTLRIPPAGNDYALLAEIETHLNLIAPPGRFRSLVAGGVGEAVSQILRNARLNDEGFSEHLVGAEIMLMRTMGRDHPDLTVAAKLLNCEKPGKPGTIEAVSLRNWLNPETCRQKSPPNAFFLYLRDGPNNAVVKTVLERCPAPDRRPEAMRTLDWIWQRSERFQEHQNDIPLWRRSMYWDCIFMGRLLRFS